MNKISDTADFTTGTGSTDLVSQMPKQWQYTSRRINRIGELNRGSRYLEIGVSKGDTFKNVNLTHKCGVDPKPKFDIDDFSGNFFEFYKMTSDEFFLNNNCDPFDVIFIDGLHTFEQTFRDFINSLALSHSKTVYIIDDTVPSSFVSAISDYSRSRKIGDLTNNLSMAWRCI